MTATKLTKSQRKLLNILDAENFDGWMETYLAWGDYDGMSDSASFATTKLVVHSVFRSLESKGLATENEYGAPVLTTAGVEVKGE